MLYLLKAPPSLYCVIFDCCEVREDTQEGEESGGGWELQRVHGQGVLVLGPTRQHRLVSI